MLIRMFLCFFFLVNGCGWSKADIYRHGAFTALMAIDYAQTMKIADNPNDYHERNPILGNNPSRAEVTAYFLTSYAIVTALAVVLPTEIRPYLQYGAIGVEAVTVGNNLSIGLGFGF
jgi:hypothetical protein